MTFSLSLGLIQFLLFAALTILGLSYSIPIIPLKSKYLGRYVKIKDIPGSKDLTEALAWGIIAALFPVIGFDAIYWPAVLISFFFVSSMCYIRTGFINLLNIQGDLIVGKETLPIALGEKRALALLIGLTAVFALITLFSAMLGLSSKLAYLFVFSFAVSFSISLHTKILHQRRICFKDHCRIQPAPGRHNRLYLDSCKINASC